MDDRLDAAYRILDAQIVDVDGRRCGRVDDVELDGDPLRVTALLTGRGVYARRLPRRLRRLGERIFGTPVLGRTVHRIPWEEVAAVDVTVRLRGKAGELGLAAADLRLSPPLEKVPRG